MNFLVTLVLSVLIELVIDTFDQSLPTGFDDIFGDTHRSPFGFMVTGLYQNSSFGVGTLLFGKDSDFLVVEIDLFKFRIKFNQSFFDGLI